MRPLATAALALALGCAWSPSGQWPGFGLSGEVVSGPVDDWSFTDAIEEIQLETRTPYGLAHSVTIWCVAIDGDLFVGASYPGYRERYWVAMVRRDPDVRLRIDGRVYERRLEPVRDPARADFVNHAFGRKYDYDVDEDPDPVTYWRVVAREVP